MCYSTTLIGQLWLVSFDIHINIKNSQINDDILYYYRLRKKLFDSWENRKILSSKKTKKNCNWWLQRKMHLYL